MLFTPQRVVSLLDMLLNYAQAFTLIVADIEKLRAQLLIYANDQGINSLTLQTPRMQEFRDNLEKLMATCQQVDQLDRMYPPIGRIITRIDQGVSPAELYHAVDALHFQLFDELNRLPLYLVDPRLAAIYDSAFPFGEEVFEKFPSAIGDVEDAAKCLALGRATATVFHCMRVMEVGLRVLSRELGIEYAPSWEAHINQIEKQLTASHKAKTASWKRKEPFFRELLGILNSVKIAWRNPTMHIARRYSAQEAEDIFKAVQTFMSALQSKYRESKKRPVAMA